MPGVDMLPQELLVEVLKHLSHADRMTCATTSKRFAEALTHPQLLKDIWFTVRGDAMGRAASVLAKSCRRYQNLQLFEVRLRKFDSGFWGRIGKTLCRLELHTCRWKPRVLYDILRECSSLEYLSMTGICGRGVLPEDLATGGTSVEDVRASLSNVKQLRLRTPSVGVLGHLLGLIPNVSSISLQVSRERFDWSTLIHRTLVDPRIVTELDLDESYPSDEELILIMRTFSEGLRELRLSCAFLTNRAAAAIADCSRLRRLSLCDFHKLENAHMTTMLRSNLGLEMLDLVNCTSLTDDGLSPIHELRKLRQLTISGCHAITNEFLCKVGEILCVEYLELGDIQLNWRAIQSIACLKNLKVLHMPKCVQSPESLRMICTNLGKLQTLSLRNCESLSDADGLMLSLLRRLRTLTLRDAPGFKDLAIEGGIGGSEMESLTVEDSSLTDLGLLSLVGQGARLKDIGLSGCDNITDQGLVALFRRAPLLEYLTLEACQSIKDGFIEALADCCPRLCHVEVKLCATSWRAVKSFEERRPTVSVIFDTYDCGDSSDE